MIDVGTYDELLARGHDLRSFSGTEVAENIDDAENVEFDESSSLWGEKPMSSTHLMQGTLNSTNAGYIEISSRFGNCTVHTQHADPDCVECMKGLNDFSGEIPVTPDILDGEEIVVFRAERSGLDENTHLNSKPEDDEVGMVSAPRERDIISADEMMSKGAVPLSAYSTYFKSVRSPILIAGMVFAFFMSNAAQFYQQYVISKWTEVGRDSSIAAALGTQYLNSLGKAAGVVSIFLWLRSFLTMRVGVNASAFLHDKMLSSVFSAPMAFFDATPSGQLLSRFGKEMETVDGALPDGIGSVLFCFLQIGFSGAALAGVITPVMLIPLSVISIMYGKTMGRFRPAARDLKRGESRTRSPVYTHFGEALRGKEIIRSIPMASETWSTRHQDLTDKNLAVYYTVKALDRWLSVRLETLGNVVVFAAAVVSVYLTRLGKLQAGSAGWGLTQALAITGLLTWAVRTLTDLETNMMSMMRVKELTDLDSVECTTPSREIIESKRQIMPKEKQNAGDALKSLYGQPLQLSTTPTSDAALVASGWPWQGDIEFNNVSMRYNEESPLVLKNVSINVPAGTTLGVVGEFTQRSTLFVPCLSVSDPPHTQAELEVESLVFYSLCSDWLKPKREGVSRLTTLTFALFH
jgi:ABC-type multidrug transport system fused ATPase/permease subunit